METNFKPLDVIALTVDIPERHLRRGEIGTILDPLTPGVWDVEFSDTLGRTYALASIHEEQMMHLYNEPAPEIASAY
jgi:hypothetical protein